MEEKDGTTNSSPFDFSLSKKAMGKKPIYCAF
jgi:hypothetical protein